MRNIKIIAAIFITSCLALNCCQPKVPAWPDNVISSIYIPKNANVEKYSQIKGSYQIKYSVIEAFPGGNYIKFVSEHMARLGWKRLGEDILSPGIFHSWARKGSIYEKWGSYIEGDKHVNIWIEDYENRKYDIIRYNLKYIFSKKEMPNVITVIVMYIPKEIRPDPRMIAEELKKANKKLQEDNQK